jgi:gamma-glutamyl-gamma-aminobutyrate hydrolase PuuD
MKPLIGIVSRVEYPGKTKKYCFNLSYRAKLLELGVDVIGILPPQTVDHTTLQIGEQPDLTEEDKETVRRQLDLCDGILLPGGFKTNKYDRYIIDYIIENDIPTLGICLGMQQLSNYKREMFQNEKNESEVQHINEDNTCTHEIDIVKDTKFHSIVNKDNAVVNSRHNYHILPNENFVNSAYAKDGYIEAIEMPEKKFILGVQFHPEDMDDDTSLSIFNAFIDAARKK